MMYKMAYLDDMIVDKNAYGKFDIDKYSEQMERMSNNPIWQGNETRKYLFDLHVQFTRALTRIKEVPLIVFGSGKPKGFYATLGYGKARYYSFATPKKGYGALTDRIWKRVKETL